ncbi:MAG: hypothetical protein AABY18_06695 [Candidatus Thermoplasmatota archaeon]
MQVRLARAVAALALAALVLVPVASARTDAFSVDGKVVASVGLLGEPVTTYAVTGLDVCFTHNMAAPRTAIAVNDTMANLLRVTLTAPSGATFGANHPLKAQSGHAGCITFDEPLMLTEAGQYVVGITMAGSAPFNGTTFALAGVKAGGPVLDRSEITFPATSVPTELELKAQVEALEARLALLEAEQAAQGEGSEFAPGAPAALLLVGLAGLAALRRRA